MGAMIWDTESQAFVEPQNVPKRYDSGSGAFVDTTGKAFDHDAQAWTEKWGQKVSAYVYGAASETITIKKNGIIIASVATDSSGKSKEKISVRYGTYTLTGSVSGWTEEQTIDENTTIFRAMPEGYIAHWFGNYPNGFSILDNKVLTGGEGGTFSAISTNIPVNLEPYQKAHVRGLYNISDVSFQAPALYAGYYPVKAELATLREQIAKSVYLKVPNNTVSEVEIDISHLAGNYYIGHGIGAVSVNYTSVIKNEHSIEFSEANVNHSGVNVSSKYFYLYLTKN